MFKYYLTYQFALGFQRACGLIPAEPARRERLLQSSGTMLNHLDRALRASDPKDELRFFCVALICLRDCRETLEEMGGMPVDVSAQHRVLHERLERIVAKLADYQGGQLRMLG